MLHTVNPISRLLSFVSRLCDDLLFGRLLASRSVSSHRRQWRFATFPALALAALLLITVASLVSSPTLTPSAAPTRSSTPSAQALAAPSARRLSPTTSTLSAAADATPSIQAQSFWSSWAVALHYVRGYSVQSGSWLCYGWPTGAYHCTQHWRGSAGHYVSLNPGWVPSQVAARSQPVHTSGVAATIASYSAAPAHMSQWAYTGRSAYPEPRGTFQGYSWGWCTSGAALLTTTNLRGLGNAVDWARNAAARGQAVGSTPRPGATVVFQPGVQGASSGGHVAHVVAVYANGWFLSQDVNFSWNGGGFGMVSFRYAHSGSGVSFIY